MSRRDRDRVTDFIGAFIVGVLVALFIAGLIALNHVRGFC